MDFPGAMDTTIALLIDSKELAKAIHDGFEQAISPGNSWTNSTRPPSKP